MTNFGTISARVAGACFSSLVTRLPGRPDEVFMTIDDGPSSLTPWIADYLRERGATATWFVTGGNADRHPETVAALGAAGHSVGNHGFEHLDAWRCRWTSIREDLTAGLEAARRASGHSCSWTRPPYGHVRPGTLEWCAANGQKLILWDVIAPDYLESINPNRVARQIRSHVRPGSIVVLHDHGREIQRETLKVTIDGLLEDGWRLCGLPATVSPQREPAQ